MAAVRSGEPESLMTTEEFCLRNRISNATFHKLQRDGRGPDVIRFSPQLIRISIEAEREWREHLGHPDDAEIKRREQAREIAVKRGRVGGAAAAESPTHISAVHRRAGATKREAQASPARQRWHALAKRAGPHGRVARPG